MIKQSIGENMINDRLIKFIDDLQILITDEYSFFNIKNLK